MESIAISRWRDVGSAAAYLCSYEEYSHTLSGLVRNASNCDKAEWQKAVEIVTGACRGGTGGWQQGGEFFLYAFLCVDELVIFSFESILLG